LIYVYVPQSNAPLVHPGVMAKLLVREYPGRDFEAAVTRTAGAIDPNSRTLLTELQIPNKDGTLFAGMYGEIEFSLTDNGNAPVIVPANAYIFRTEGPQVVLVRGMGRSTGRRSRWGAITGQNWRRSAASRMATRWWSIPPMIWQEGMQVTAQEAKPAAAQGSAGGQGGTANAGGGAGSSWNATGGGNGVNASGASGEAGNAQGGTSQPAKMPKGP